MQFPFFPVVLGLAIVGALTGWRLAQAVVRGHWFLKIVAGFFLVVTWVLGGAMILLAIIPRLDPENLWHVALVFGWVAGVITSGVSFMTVSTLSRYRRFITD